VENGVASYFPKELALYCHVAFYSTAHEFFFCLTMLADFIFSVS